MLEAAVRDRSARSEMETPESYALLEDLDAHGRVIEVQTFFRGLAIGARALPHPRELRRRAAGTRWLIAGAFAAALALTMPIIASRQTDDPSRSELSGTSAEVSGTSAGWDVVFVGSVLAGGAMMSFGLWRRRGRGGRVGFLIGSEGAVDAPADSACLAGPTHALLAPVGNDYAIRLSPHMRGSLTIANQTTDLREALGRVPQRESVFPPGARADIVCGELSFAISSTPRQPTVGRRRHGWRDREHLYTAGAALGLAAFVATLLSVPRDPEALALSWQRGDARFIGFRVFPPEVVTNVGARAPDDAPQRLAAAERPAQERGVAGDARRAERTRRYAVAGPHDTLTPRLGQQPVDRAVETARRAGILGLFREDRPALAAILSRDETALGRDAESVIGALAGPELGQAWGLDGLGVVGTGQGGGGTGEGTLGHAKLGTVGRFGGGDDAGAGRGGGARRGYGDCSGGACALAHRVPRGPIATPGILNVKGGGLDKEIIRRVVRRHVNEVKYCYEQGMRANPTLGGRVVVSFTIGRNGEVLSSVLQSSSLRSVAVESCVVQAVRRWTFPQPSGGGLAIVSYPFLLTPAGELTGSGQSSD